MLAEEGKLGGENEGGGGEEKGAIESLKETIITRRYSRGYLACRILFCEVPWTSTRYPQGAVPFCYIFACLRERKASDERVEGKQKA